MLMTKIVVELTDTRCDCRGKDIGVYIYLKVILDRWGQLCHILINFAFIYRLLCLFRWQYIAQNLCSQFIGKSRKDSEI